MKRAKSALTLIIALLFSALAGTVHIGAVQAVTSINGIIFSDTTWTNANSPYTLTGPVAVNVGVTLTVEAGVSIDLNDQYIQVNGTLVAIGSASNWIQFNGGQLIFKPVSNGWNEQTGSGSQMEYVSLNSVSSSVPLKLSHCQTDGDVSLGGPSIISDSLLSGRITIVGSSKVLRSTITSSHEGIKITSNVDSTIAHNTITAGNSCAAIEIVGGSSVISDNHLSGGGVIIYPPPGDPRVGVQIYAVDIKSGVAEISNNNINGGISTGNSSSITNNILTNASIHISDGSPTVSGNTYVGYGGITVGDSKNSGVDSPVIFNNTVSYISVCDGSVQIQGNIVHGNNMNIGIGFKQEYQRGNSLVANNQVYNCCYGLFCWSEGGTPTATFQKNSVANCVYGMTISGGSVTIRNNSLANNYFGIYLSSLAVVDSINYNNIQTSNKSNLFLKDIPNDINAAYNWWGTTDASTINQTIVDYKNDFNLGNVTFVPFLEAPNPQAPSLSSFVEPSASPSPSPTPAGSSSPSPSPTATPSTQSSQNPTATPSQSDYQDAPLSSLNWEHVAIIFLSVTVAVLLVAVIVFMRRSSKLAPQSANTPP